MRQPLVQSLPRVDIIYAHADDDGIFVKAAMEAGAKGIIHAGTGHGSISYAVEAALYEAAKNGCIVVRASRVVTGAVLNGHQRWQDAGFIPSRALSAQKSRILLQLLIHRYGPHVKKSQKSLNDINERKLKMNKRLEISSPLLLVSYVA